MRVTVSHLGSHANIRQQFDDTALAVGRSADAMHIKWFTNNLCDRPAWTQRRKRILKDDLHPAPLCAEFTSAQPENILAIDEDLSGCRLLQTQYRPAERRFSATRFADEPECVPLGNREIDPIDRTYLSDNPLK